MVFITIVTGANLNQLNAICGGPHIVKVMVIYHDKNQDKMTIYKITNLP